MVATAKFTERGLLEEIHWKNLLETGSHEFIKIHTVLNFSVDSENSRLLLKV